MLMNLYRKRSNQPERSLPLRLAILAAMLTPLLAIARVAPPLWPHVLATALLMLAGHWYSYRHLDKSNRIVQGITFVAIHLALLWLFIGLFRGFTVPQAQFAIFSQGITSFDLRYRRSLFNTLLHSLAILYVAASLSRTYELVLYLLLFTGLVLAAFFIAGQADGRRTARLAPRSPTPTRSLVLFGISFGAVALLSLVVVFLFTPRFTNNPIVPPFTINTPLRGGVRAEIINPGLPLVQINGWSNGTSDYFYGFDTNLDLRYRGGLSDAIVMYVRSPSRGYWRSHSYDYYTGVSWEQSDPTLTTIDPGGVYFKLEPPPGSALERPVAGGPEPERIVQSFTIVREQPNLLFATYRPAEILILAARISLDRGDSIRLPEILRPGLTYSAISYRPDFDPDRLRREPAGPYPADISRRYLQLPDNISGRVKELARNLTAPYDNNYDRALALTNHLLSQYRYNFFPPPHPPGAEVVDTFLFEDQEGVCEQYVTALVVLARSLGIPARLATGYGSGDYNPITNYYEVRLNHAHSWAEVYFPESGWVPFDPTPGWTPQPYPTPVQNWLFANHGLGLQLPIAPLADFAAGLARLLFFVPFLAGSAVVVWLALLAAYLARRFWPTLAIRKARPGRATAVHPQRQLILKLYRQGVKLLAGRQNQRQPWETLSEYARRAGHLPAFTRLTRAAEIAAYRPAAPEADTVEAAEDALRELREEVAGKRPPMADR